MKHKIEIKEIETQVDEDTTEKHSAAVVTLKAKTGEEFTFNYLIDGPQFMNLMATMSSLEKRNKENEFMPVEVQAKQFIKLFKAVKQLVTETVYDDIMEFCDETGDSLSLVEFVQLVSDFNAEEAGELPKKSKRS